MRKSISSNAQPQEHLDTEVHQLKRDPGLACEALDGSALVFELRRKTPQHECQEKGKQQRHKLEKAEFSSKAYFRKP